MSAERVRLVGGPLSGQVLWIEAGKTSLQVHVAARGDGFKRTFEYRRDGFGLLFAGEVSPVTPTMEKSAMGETRE